MPETLPAPHGLLHRNPEFDCRNLTLAGHQFATYRFEDGFGPRTILIFWVSTIHILEPIQKLISGNTVALDERGKILGE
jgi:hypothetical protein